MTEKSMSVWKSAREDRVYLRKLNDLLCMNGMGSSDCLIVTTISHVLEMGGDGTAAIGTIRANDVRFFSTLSPGVWTYKSERVRQ